MPTKKISTKLEIQEENPSKSKIHAVNPTKSKIQDDNPKIPMPEEEDFEDSFDRMCNVNVFVQNNYLLLLFFLIPR